MPNVAVMVQESFTVYSSDTDITSNDKKIINMIFGAMGKYYEIEEKHMDGIKQYRPSDFHRKTYGICKNY